MRLTQVRKRDGRIVEFERHKIVDAIWKAAESVGGEDQKKAEEIADKVVAELEKSRKIHNVEDVQDAVEKVLIEEGHAKTAKAYILYRQKRRELREAKEQLGVKDDIKLAYNAIRILERRYLLKDVKGKVIETPGDMFRRVAKAIASAEKKLDTDKEEIRKLEDEFYEMMKNLEFLPNSPTLMNAGTDVQQCSACYVLPIEDSLESIFETLKQAAIIQKTGGGTGYSFSRIRPKGDVVKTTGGVASGPINFIKVFNTVTEAVKQGGRRRGANMGILRVDHPDIMEFVIAKEKDPSLINFNLSVALTDKFMRAVENDEDYDIINPRNGEVMHKLSAERVFNLIVTMAWKSGDPGVIFIDRMNKSESNPVPSIGMIESTDSCGESPLLPYESCVLGSINLSKFVKEKDMDWDRLKETICKAVRFLDNVIEINDYPLKETEKITKANRRIGLGVMGFADALIMLGIQYNSDEAVSMARKTMKFINEESKEASSDLGKNRGSFPNFKESIWADKYKHLRNATTTTIAPTGSISIIAGCSSGIEPLFAISYIRTILDNTDMLEVNRLFERIATERGFYSEPLMRVIAKQGSIQDMREIPNDVKKLFVTTHDITPDDHIKIQSSFQKHVDNGVSKTVNIPNDSRLEEVEKIYMLAYKSGCKGITIYRDRSREDQVLNIESS